MLSDDAGTDTSAVMIHVIRQSLHSSSPILLLLSEFEKD